VTLISVITLIFCSQVLAHHRASHWQPSAVWLRQALCIHRHEGGWHVNTGNGYYGGMQFALSTWRRAGGSGYPHVASVREQLFRAWRIWRMNGGSWAEWPTRRYCGLL